MNAARREIRRLANKSPVEVTTSLGGVLLDGRNHGCFIWDCGVIEGEKDGTEEGCRLIVGVLLKIFINVDDKG